MSSAFDRRMKEINDQQLHRFIYNFLDRWGPIEPHQRAEFDADLHMLVQRMYIEAITPLRDMIIAATINMAHPAIMIEKPPK